MNCHVQNYNFLDDFKMEFAVENTLIYLIIFVFTDSLRELTEQSSSRDRKEPPPRFDMSNMSDDYNERFVYIVINCTTFSS